MSTVHKTEWCEDEESTKLSVGGNVAFRDCKLKSNNGYVLGAVSDINNKFSCIDYFLMMFSNAHIQKIRILTNRHILIVKKPETTIGEILNCFSVLILPTEFDFVSRITLWSSVTPSKYALAPCIGKLGITRNCFDDIWAYFQFSD